MNTDTAANFRITNDGDAAISGSISSNHGDFTVSPQSYSFNRRGDYVDVTVTFTPRSRTYIEGTISVSGAGGLRVYGTGLQLGTLSLDRGSIGFGNIRVGLSGSGGFRITNAGDLTLSGSLASNHGYFSISPSSFSLGGGQFVDIGVTFTPGAMGEASGTISVSSNGGSGSISISGLGLDPEVRLGVGAIDFGPVEVNTSLDREVEVFNDGNTDLVISAVTSSDGQFVVSPSSMTVVAGSRGVVAVRLTPSAPGERAAVVSLSSDDRDEAISTVALRAFGTKAEVEVDPISLELGLVSLGSSVRRSVQVFNRGDAVLRVGTVRSSDGEMTVSVPSFEVPVGGVVGFEVVYAPLVSGGGGSSRDFAGQVELVSNDLDTGRLLMNVSGRVGVPDIEVGSGFLDFGVVARGEPKVLSLAVRNRGESVLSVRSVSVDSSLFSLSASSLEVFVGGEGEVAVTLSPEVSGAVGGTLVLVSNDPDEGEVRVALGGNGTVAKLSAAPSPVMFGEVLVGGSGSGVLRVTNNGDAILHILSMGSVDGRFSVVPQTADIAPFGGFAEFTVGFSPDVLGEVASDVVVVSNDPDGDRTVPVVGVGISPEIEVIPTSLDFGQVSIGDRRERTIVIRNTGSADLVVSEVRTTVADYSVGVRSVTIPEGGEQEVSVVFAPQGVAEMPGTLVIASSDLDEAAVRVPLMGEGITDLDLTVSHLEVTQAIQDGANSVPLILGKPSMVRASVGIETLVSARYVRGVDGVLWVYEDGVLVEGSPFRSLNGPIVARALADRGVLDDTLNFLLPLNLLSEGGVRAEVELNPHLGAHGSQVLEMDYTNNRSVLDLSFIRRPVPRVGYIPISYRDRGLPRQADVTQGVGWMRKVFPAPNVIYKRLPPLSFEADINAEVDGILNANRLMTSLFIASQLATEALDHVYGWLSGDPYRDHGAAAVLEGGTRIAFGNTDPGRYLRTVVHEMGHNYGLVHHARALGEVGVDVLGQVIKPASLFDFMVPGRLTAESWVDVITYRFLIDHGPLVLRQDLVGDQEDQLLVSGFVRRAGGGMLQPAWRRSAPKIGLEGRGGGGRYSLSGVGPGGESLWTIGLPVSFEVSDSEGVADSAPFMIVVPAASGLTKLSLLENDTPIDDLQTSPSPPTVRFVSPPGGETAGSSFVVSWDGGDPDGDPLTYTLLYTADGGASYVTVAVQVSETSYTLDLTGLPGSKAARLRLMATDGLLTTTLDSEPFVVSTKGPQVILMSPRDHETYAQGSPLILEARAVDPEDGDLPDEAIEWRSDIEGVLGKGARLVVDRLSMGIHRIGVRATDSDGSSSEAQTTVHVIDLAVAPRVVVRGPASTGEGERVVLDASETTDPNPGDELSFAWSQTSGPSVALEEASEARVFFQAPSVSGNTALEFLVTARDLEGHVATGHIAVVVLDTAFSALQLDRAAIDFGPVSLGEVRREILQLTNVGDEPLQIEQAMTSSDEFISKLEAVVVGSGESIDLPVELVAKEVGEHNATLEVKSNSRDGMPGTVHLKAIVKAIGTAEEAGNPMSPEGGPTDSPDITPFGSESAPPSTPGFLGPNFAIAGGGGGCSLVPGNVSR